MHARDANLKKQNSGVSTRPVEKRVIDTVKWVSDNYDIDPNRVYLSGNSMGGSGALGIGLRHGNIFAAIKANVPAGIEHADQRMSLSDFKKSDTKRIKSIEYGKIFIIISVSGFLACYFDSILGSTLQGKYKCKKCGQNNEIGFHCNQSSELISGIKIFTNNLVNFLCSAFGGIILIALLYFLRL